MPTDWSVPAWARGPEPRARGFSRTLPGGVPCWAIWFPDPPRAAVARLGPIQVGWDADQPVKWGLLRVVHRNARLAAALGRVRLVVFRRRPVMNTEGD